MIEQDMKAYLDKIDCYINKSIELIEQASRIYGYYIDDSGFNPENIINLRKLFEDFRKIYFRISNYTIDDLAPDPFQDLDSSVHTFTSVCDNCIYFLTKLAEQDGGNHWLIKKYFEDCQKDYKKLFNHRNNSEVTTLSECRLPMILKIDSESRILGSISQRLKESQIICRDCWLSRETSSTQLNIELVIADTEKRELLGLALWCARAIKEELSFLTQVKIIFISFRTSERLCSGWIQCNRDILLSFTSEGCSLDDFEKNLFMYYCGDIVIAAKKLSDLVEHSSSLNRDFGVKEILIEAAKQLEVIAKRSTSDPDPLINQTLELSFQRALLDCMLILLKVVSVTKDPDVAQKFIHLASIFHLSNGVNASRDYNKLFQEISYLIDILKLRYIVIPNTRKVSLGVAVCPRPRIAIVQPRIWIALEIRLTLVQ